MKKNRYIHIYVYNEITFCTPETNTILWINYSSSFLEKIFSHLLLRTILWGKHHYSCFTGYCGEGNGNPLQCSCLENPRDGRTWAAVYGLRRVGHAWSDLAAAAAVDMESWLCCVIWGSLHSWWMLENLWFEPSRLSSESLLSPASWINQGAPIQRCEPQQGIILVTWTKTIYTIRKQPIKFYVCYDSIFLLKASMHLN